MKLTDAMRNAARREFATSGGLARKAKLTKARRIEIATHASRIRWAKERAKQP